MRIVAVAVLVAVMLVAGLPSRDASAATVGNCDAVVSYPQTASGTIRRAGASQCFAMFLEHGFIYTITIDAGPREYAGSTSLRAPLGDSVLVLYKSRFPGISVSDPYDAGSFDYVGMNDDYALPTHLGSRITYEVTGNPRMSTLFVARVSGFNQAVGTFTLSVTRSVEVDLDGCEHIFAC